MADQSVILRKIKALPPGDGSKRFIVESLDEIRRNTNALVAFLGLTQKQGEAIFGRGLKKWLADATAPCPICVRLARRRS